MRQVSAMVQAAFILIGLYLVLRFGANAGRVIEAIATGAANVFRTLQGHPTSRTQLRTARAR